MACGPKLKKWKTFYIDNTPVDTVNTFYYLGVTFSGSGNRSYEIANGQSKMNRSAHGVFKFATKLGNCPIKDMIAIYKARSFATAMYGAEVWGYHCSQVLQREENSFLKRLLSLPHSASNEIIHREVGYLADLISLRPLLLWRSIWAKVETNFTKLIIMDCLLLDKIMCICWLRYISNTYSKLFNLSIQLNPLQVTTLTKPVIKNVL